jgi:hypothetical protein
MKITYFYYFIFFLLSSYTLTAQGNLFEEVSGTDAELTSEEENMLSALVKEAITKNVYLVRLGNINKFQENGLVQFKLPSGDVISAEVEDIDYKSENDFVWSGTVRGKLQGSIVISSSQEGQIGTINTDEKLFEIYPIRGDYHALVERDRTKYPNGTCGNEGYVDAGVAPPVYLCEDANNCAATIDVLVLVHSEAWGAFGLPHAKMAVTLPQQAIKAAFLKELTNMPLI